MKRKPLPKIPKLKRKCWKIMSKYVRLRDSDVGGTCSCCTCGKLMFYKQCHAGHYYPKSLGLKIYFEEKNTHSQCAGCNLFKHGNLAEYAPFLEKKYGHGILQELQKIRNSKPMGTADSRAFLEEKIIYYTAQLEVEKIRTGQL